MFVFAAFSCSSSASARRCVSGSIHGIQANALANKSYKDIGTRRRRLPSPDFIGCSTFHGAAADIYGNMIEAEKAFHSATTKLKCSRKSASDRNPWRPASLSAFRPKVSTAKDEARRNRILREAERRRSPRKYLSEVRRSIKSKLNSNNYPQMLERTKRRSSSVARRLPRR